MQHIAVIGISSFGYYMCKYLSDTGVHVLAIDSDETKVESVKTFVDRAIIADATQKETLARLELQEFDQVIISVGEHIDTGILITLYLKELGVKKITVKAFTEDHVKILHLMGASNVIFPEKDSAERLAYTFQHKNLLEYFPISDDYGVIEITVPNPWLGKNLIQLDVRRKYNVQIVLIKEVLPNNKVSIPLGNQPLKDSDTLVILGPHKDLETIQNL